MKKTLLLISILFFVHTAFGQAYIITYIKGNVYHNNQPLKLHDRLDGTTELTSTDKTAELALFSAQKGKYRLNFVNSKAVAAGAAAKNSELYQLVVGNYLLAYTTEKTLTTRGDFDLKIFLNDTATHIYLPAGGLLPLKSQSITIGPQDEFFVCTVTGKDTICSPISRNNSFLIWDDKTLKGIAGAGDQTPKPLTCFIMRDYVFNGKHVREPFSGALNITFLSKAYLQDLTGSFREGMTGYYQDNKGKLIADVEDQLSYYYGRSFEPAIRQVLNTELK